MPKLPIISAGRLLKALIKIGYRIVRQKGSHIRLHCDGNEPVTIPLHKEIGKGLLRKILRDADLTADQLIELLKK